MNLKRITILLAVGVMTLYGCHIKEYFFDPNNIVAASSQREADIQWDENKPIGTANILSFAIECFPVKTYKSGELFGGRTIMNVKSLQLDKCHEV